MTTQTFGQLVQTQAAAIQARAAGLVDFSVGAIARAASEAFAGVVLWLQGLILQLLATTRAATCQGPDLDSWVADWGGAPAVGDVVQIARLPAQAATGVVTFSRASATQQAVIQVGATVQSLDGSQSYAVTIDTANGAYSSALGGYVLPANTTSITAPVAAQTAGAAGNAAAGAVNTITSAIPGVDDVINASAFINGADAESDGDFLARFQRWIIAIGKGTQAAIQAAVENLQQKVSCQVFEAQNFDGTSHPGYFCVVMDDGTGSPPSTLLTAAGAAVDAVHAEGIPFNVYAPTVVNIAIAATIVADTTADHPAAVIAATATLTAYVNALPIGQAVYYSRIWQLIQDASSSIVEVTGLTVNGGTADVTVGTRSVAKISTITLS